jgi:hypothetical protein
MGNFYGLIGAFQTNERRYIDYVDGSIMTDGYMNSVSNQVFKELNILSFLRHFCSNQHYPTSSVNILFLFEFKLKFEMVHRLGLDVVILDLPIY